MTERHTTPTSEAGETTQLSTRSAAVLEVAMLKAALDEAQTEYDRLHEERSPDASKIGRAIIQLTDWLIKIHEHVSIAEELEGDSRAPLSTEGHQLLQDIFGDVSVLELDLSHIPAITDVLDGLEQDSTHRKMLPEAREKIAALLTSHYGDGPFEHKKLAVHLRLKRLKKVIVTGAGYSQEYAFDILIAGLTRELDGVDDELEDYDGEIAENQFANHVSYDELVSRVDPHPISNEVTSRYSWKSEALCAETDPEAFFPEIGLSAKEAKKICTSCGVAPECLEYALTNDEVFGIWGGKSTKERKAIAEKRLEKIVAEKELNT